MTAPTHPATTLSGRLAGSDGAGRFSVERPGTWADRAIAAALRLPRPGPDVAVALRVRAGRSVDRWERRFDGRRLVSRQTLDGTAIEERVGPIVLHLHAEDRPGGSCRLTSTGASVAIGRRRWRLADRWCPKVACEVAMVGADRRRVDVEVAAPCGRVLSRYGGVLVDLPPASAPPEERVG